jgi:hypothetical protein
MLCWPDDNPGALNRRAALGAGGLKRDADISRSLPQGEPVTVGLTKPAILQRADLSPADKLEGIADRGLPGPVLSIDDRQALALLERQSKRLDRSSEVVDPQRLQATVTHTPAPRA